MHIGTALLASVLTASIAVRADAAPFEGQFDLRCEGKEIVQNISRDWTVHYSVDIGRGLYCVVNTVCRTKTPLKFSRITPDELVFRDRPSEGKSGLLVKVNAATNELTAENYQPGNIQMVARAVCRREQFSPFQVITSPG